MRLRSSTRRPGRYREDDIPDLPTRASFAHPTISFNPNLPPAAFPTLDQPRPVQEEVPVLDEFGALQDAQSTVVFGGIQRPATIFHGQIRPANQAMNISIRPRDDNPGELEKDLEFSDDEDVEQKLRVHLHALEPTVRWNEFSDALKLIIIAELMKGNPFAAVVKALRLTHLEVGEVYDLVEKEVVRQEDEDERIVAYQARQLEVLLARALSTSNEPFPAQFTEYLYGDLSTPPTFTFSKKDLRVGQRFLRDLGLNSCANRLLQYHGIAVSSNLTFVRPPPQPEPASGEEVEDDNNVYDEIQLAKDLQSLHPDASDQTDPSLRTGKKRKLNSGSESRSRKRLRIGTRFSALKVGTGLRNSFTAENPELVAASAPAALQLPVVTPQKRPVHQTPLQNLGTPAYRVKNELTVNPRKPVTLRPQISISSPEPTASLNPSRTPLPGKRGNGWLFDYNPPFTPVRSSNAGTPSKQSTLSSRSPTSVVTPSRAPRRPKSPAYVRLAQMNSILGKRGVAISRTSTTARSEAVVRAPLMGVPPSILPEKMLSASKNAAMSKNTMIWPEIVVRAPPMGASPQILPEKMRSASKVAEAKKKNSRPENQTIAAHSTKGGKVQPSTLQRELNFADHIQTLTGSNTVAPKSTIENGVRKDSSIVRGTNFVRQDSGPPRKRSRVSRTASKATQDGVEGPKVSIEKKEAARYNTKEAQELQGVDLLANNTKEKDSKAAAARVKGTALIGRVAQMAIPRSISMDAINSVPLFMAQALPSRKRKMDSDGYGFDESLT